MCNVWLRFSKNSLIFFYPKYLRKEANFSVTLDVKFPTILILEKFNNPLSEKFGVPSSM